MPIERIHAYSVSPTPQGQPVNISGGDMPLSAELNALIGDNVRRAAFPTCLDTNFRFDANRRNTIRELIVNYGFSAAPEAQASARSLAERLAHAMDLRSKSCLFVICSNEDGPHRDVTIWTFPREDAIRLNALGRQSRIEVLTDVFSQSSHYRKACFYRGTNHRTQFLGGKILDFQAKQANFNVAQFWIEDFLQSELALTRAAGTKLLSETLKKLSTKKLSFDDQKQIHAAAISVRVSQRVRWTPTDFANHYFDRDLSERFLNELPNRASRNMLFDFDKEEFDKRLGFTTYELEQGVIVSAPFNEVGRTVQLEGVDGRQLICRGRITSERIKSRRHA